MTTGAVDRVRTVFDFWWQKPEFVDVLDCAELPPKRYRRAELTGAILLTVNGVTVFDEGLISDIPLLWGFVADLVAEYRENGRGRTRFPDQSIEISLEPVPRKLLRITVAGGDLRRTSVAGEEELLSALAAGGVEFFEKMAELTGGNYSTEIRRLTGK